ncbi:MAG TPA: alpha/beta fold hydrolase [Anaerolineales bacterium]|nr:alpha/beta fold hydrolase [Anaerolineales bacterium]
MNIVLWILIILIVLILATGTAFSFYYTKRGQLGEVHNPDEYGLQYEPVEFQATDGVILRGVWIPAPGSDKAVIILHGHDSSYDFDVYRAPTLHEAGFNVLLFDFRAHGRSDGNMKTFGYKERWDVLGGIEFLKKRGMQHFGLLGFSYGGLTAMLTAPICPEVEAVITDGGPTRLMTGAGAWGDELGSPRWLTTGLAWVFFNITSLRLGVNIFRYEPIRWVGKISPRPVFFIHGDHDQFCADFDDLYAAAREPKELWRLPEAGHTTASQLYPEEHARRVIDFFKRYL